MTALPRGNAPEVPVGRVAVAKTGRGPVRGRFERDYMIVRHVGMPLEYLWTGWPWRGPVRARPENRPEDRAKQREGNRVED